MKQKILTMGCTILLTIMLITLTGCGNSNNKNYSEDIQNVRNQTVGILNDKTFGAILDVALENEKWSENDNYSLKGGAVIVKGKDKNSGDDVEIVWLKKAKEASSNFEKMTKGGEEIGYSQFLSYLQEYEDSVKD